MGDNTEENEVGEGNVIFDKEMAKKLHNIDLMVARLIYDEIEKLELNGINKVMAHYYVAKSYFDTIQKTMIDVGIKDVIVNIKDEK